MADNEVTGADTSRKPFDYSKRPVHIASLNRKLPCPHHFCSKNVFFFEVGVLDHHMRAIHKAKVRDDDMKAARRLLNELFHN